MKKISVMTACFNEEPNIAECYGQVKKVFEKLPAYQYEHLFIDNGSKDQTVAILKEIAKKDKNVKIIVNTRNFGHIRSPFYGILQTSGDAVISIVADLQDPPSLIFDFIKKWEEGYKVVVGIKRTSNESRLMFAVRNAFYRIISRLSEVDQIRNFTGFGLYDKRVIEILRTIDDPYPYFRGLISDLGFEVAKIEYAQPARKKGRTKNNFYSLYDMAMLGITNYSKIPLRLAWLLCFLHVRHHRPWLSFIQAHFLEQFLRRHGAAGHRFLFYHLCSAVLYRDAWRIHRLHTDTGHETPSGHRKGKG
jgi:glycosyltransferase involved in cell wall biosynthesis